MLPAPEEPVRLWERLVGYVVAGGKKFGGRPWLCHPATPTPHYGDDPTRLQDTG